MAIEDKILTISAREYVESINKKLSDYGFVGVHVIGKTSVTLLEDFQKKVPSNAEVVVAYNTSSATGGSSGGMYAHYYAGGTALVPKKNSE